MSDQRGALNVVVAFVGGAQAGLNLPQFPLERGRIRMEATHDVAERVPDLLKRRATLTRVDRQRGLKVVYSALFLSGDHRGGGIDYPRRPPEFAVQMQQSGRSDDSSSDTATCVGVGKLNAKAVGTLHRTGGRGPHDNGAVDNTIAIELPLAKA
jgi:hypothetical protein